MIHWYHERRIGYIYTYQNGRTSMANIFGGNCLCVFTYFFKDKKTGKQMESFTSFLGDEQHIKNCVKDGWDICPYVNVRSIRLNLYYKEAQILAKYFTMQGHKVVCYYKEPKKAKK